MAVRLEHISKTYNGRQVLKDFSVELEQGKNYCLMGPSGIGKTTLLRILMGLEQAEEGRIVCGPDRPRISAVFQENRLIEFEDAWRNVSLAVGRRERPAADPQAVLSSLLEREAWTKPVCRLSGGMQRRVAIARALVAPSGILVMDEPFTGLDQATRDRTIQAVLRFQEGRTLLLVTHQEEDAELFGAEKIFLPSAKSM